MAAKEPIFKMTFLKSISSSELISCKMWDLEQKNQGNSISMYIYVLAIEAHRAFFIKYCKNGALLKKKFDYFPKNKQ